MPPPSSEFPNTWRLLYEADLPVEVLAQLQNEIPDKRVLKQFLLDAYNSQSEDRTRDKALGTDFIKWLWFQLEHGDAVQSVLMRRWPRLQTLLFETFSSKVTKLSQRHCFICGGTHPPSALFPIYVLPVRITPISRQATTPMLFRAFKKAICSHFERRSIDIRHSRLCLAVTFVLDSQSRDRDIDNMVKAFQDALAEALGFNDRHILHLDVIKLRFRNIEECLYVRIAPSYLNEHDDVVLQQLNHSWAGQEALDLEKFM